MLHREFGATMLPGITWSRRRRLSAISRPLCLLSLGLVFLGTSLTASAATNPYQGVYMGTIILTNSSYPNRLFPCWARMTVMPDGRSMFLTVQLPNNGGVLNIAGEGGFQGNLFEGSSRGRFNFLNYATGSQFKIRFLHNQAVILTNRPPNYVFHKVRS
jgi:hypothetical protein